MSENVVIYSEKPSQAKAYSLAYEVEKRDKTSITLKPCSTFKNGAIITWGIGHLVELKKPEEYDEKYKTWSLENLPIIPEFSYKVKKDVAAHYNSVAKILKKADTLILSTDSDREGELLGILVFLQALGSNFWNRVKLKRLWINSLEVDVIRKGFLDLKEGKETHNLFIEAQSRQKADWLIGMNFSPYYTLKLKESQGFKEVLSIGRVQTPCVVLINERQQEIKKFVSKPFYQIEGKFDSENGSYNGLADIKTGNKKEVENIIANQDIQNPEMAHVKSVEKKEKRTKSPKLHSLSTLQTIANKNWKYSPSDTLKIVQGLYEKKLLSYPRTDCNYITENEFEYIVENLDQYKKIMKVDFETVSTQPRQRYVNSKFVQEHYAIVPTKTIPERDTLNSLNDKEKNIYNEVVLNTLAMFHEDYIYEETSIITNVKGIEFKTTGKVEIDKGWKNILTVIKEQEEKGDKSLPLLSENEKVKAFVNIKEGKTTPPKPYTEGDLINMMKNCGSSLAEKEDSKILKEVEGIGTEATRAGIIDRIKQQGYIEVNKNIVTVTKKGEVLCDVVAGTLLASPKMTAKWELYLKKIGEGIGSQEAFIKNTIKFIEKTINESDQNINSQNIENKINEMNESQSVGKCPVCKNGLMLDKKTFYSCSEYKNNCNFTISKKIADKKLTEKNIKDLLVKGKTTKIKGFKSKKGTKFDAVLIIKDNKISFEF